MFGNLQSTLTLNIILPLVCAVFVVFLGSFVFFKNVHASMNRLFGAFCLAMSLWMFGTFMMFLNRNNDAAALAWDRFVYLGVSFMPTFMHHFSLVFTKYKGQRKLLVLNYILSVFFLFASQTPYFVDDLYKYSWGVHSQARILHHVFLGFFYFGVQLFLLNLIRYYRRSRDPLLRKQIIYTMVAFAIVVFVGGSAYLMAYGIDLKFPFAYISGLIFPFMLFYAITRHHLMGSKVIATEVSVGLILFVLVAQLFLSTSLVQLIARAGIVLAMTLFSVMLIRGVNNEVRRREEMEQLTYKLEEAYTKLKEVDNAKTDFLSLASHQLRSPLTVIRVGIGALIDGTFGPVKSTKQKDALGKIMESADRLIQLISEYLDISRIELGKMQYKFASADLGKLVTDIADEYRQRAQIKGLKFILKPVKKLPQVNCDEDKMRQVISNLVDNAIKYTPDGSITIDFSKDKNQVRFAVSDTGYGLSTEDLGAIFEKFKRRVREHPLQRGEHESPEGSGLGLHVAKMFIEAHNGKIWAESRGHDKGSSFIFTVPIKGPDIIPETVAPKPAAPFVEASVSRGSAST